MGGVQRIGMENVKIGKNGTDAKNWDGKCENWQKWDRCKELGQKIWKFAIMGQVQRIRTENVKIGKKSSEMPNFTTKTVY